ncbi:MAG: hypothetical protein RLY86_3478 [Pseudomonadota bacterium]|jgi:methyl-accepting chemotaxis protein
MAAISTSTREGTDAVAAGRDQVQGVADHIGEIGRRVDATSARMSEIAAFLEQQSAAPPHPTRRSD